MGRPSFEAYPSEIALIVAELALARRKLGSWTKPERVPTAMACQPGRSFIYREPLGVVLIIGPWNYPLQLLLLPLVGAIAAGNCAVLKPSELAPATSSLIARRLPEYLDRGMRAGSSREGPRRRRPCSRSDSITSSSPAARPSAAS